ncbi:MAG: metallophosphoesterase [Betaproteobacteria bacterium]|nr:metallophosphoesterase [Betaproteobacteria bacterium]
MRYRFVNAAIIGLAWLCLIPPAAAEGSAVYVVLGPEGQAIVRVLDGSDHACPDLDVDGRSVPMRVRAEPQTEGLRQQAAFPVLACELVLPEHAHHVLFEGRELPLPVATVQRIVVLGDSGCRMKWPVSFQDCNDPARWPLARIARSAAAEHPDLVIHVGDYNYRESRCLTGGCSGSPHGYGWDTWWVDFFDPAKTLLEAAPWVMIRGNHESCARAGQGWFRFLDARGYDATRACRGGPPYAEDFTEPFAVPLGKQRQLIVFDSAGASDHNRLETYAIRWAQAAELAARQPYNWLVLHHPVLGYGYRPLSGYFTDGGAAGAALEGSRFPDLTPSNIQLVLQGHIHTFEINQFQGNLPLSLLAGIGGSALEDSFPDGLPQSIGIIPGARLIQSRSSQQFGYVLLERREQDWVLYEKDPEGGVRRQCTLTLVQPPYALNCEP